MRKMSQEKIKTKSGWAEYKLRLKIEGDNTAGKVLKDFEKVICDFRYTKDGLFAHVDVLERSRMQGLDLEN